MPITKIENALKYKPMIDNPNGMYSNLPNLNENGRVKGRGGISKEQRLQFKLQMQEESMKKAEKRRQDLTNQINEAKENKTKTDKLQSTITATNKRLEQETLARAFMEQKNRELLEQMHQHQTSDDYLQFLAWKE